MTATTDLRGQLLEAIKTRGSMSIQQIHRRFNVNPQNEEDRKMVWRIGQTLAELVNGDWLSVERETHTYTYNQL